MGSDIGVKCKNCGSEDSFHLGGGMGPWFRKPSIETLLEILQEKEALHLVYLRDKRQGKIKNYPTNTYYECPKCETLHSHFYYEISYDNGKTYTKSYFCKKCGGELRVLPEDIEIDFGKFRCKKCGKKELVNMGVLIRWF